MLCTAVTPVTERAAIRSADARGVIILLPPYVVRKPFDPVTPNRFSWVTTFIRVFTTGLFVWPFPTRIDVSVRSGGRVAIPRTSITLQAKHMHRKNEVSDEVVGVKFSSDEFEKNGNH